MQIHRSSNAPAWDDLPGKPVGSRVPVGCAIPDDLGVDSRHAGVVTTCLLSTCETPHGDSLVVAYRS